MRKQMRAILGRKEDEPASRSAKICKDFGSGSPAKFRGQVAQGSIPFHYVPSFQGKAD
jgi:hypothetical protein